jgi:hypothetical protein
VVEGEHVSVLLGTFAGTPGRKTASSVPLTIEKAAAAQRRTAITTRLLENATPGLVEFCKNEAKDVEIPLFGRNRSVTVEGQMAKDSATFALMQVAQQIRETWRREDKMAAEEQCAAADAALKRLESVVA